MTTPDADKKRLLFEHWLKAHAPGREVRIAPRQQQIDVARVVNDVQRLATTRPAPNYVYILAKQEEQQLTPLYIGKSQAPHTRWKSHLTGLLKGDRSYAAWNARLLRAHQVVDDLVLFIIAETDIEFPPIPQFPTKVGAVEYQLVGLAEDAYPGVLLNVEGKAK